MSQVRGRGRPPIYVGFLARAIVAVLRIHGLTKTQELLAKQKLVQKAPGKPKQKLKVSIPTLSKLAESHGVKFRRGRPKLAA